MMKQPRFRRPAAFRLSLFVSVLLLIPCCVAESAAPKLSTSDTAIAAAAQPVTVLNGPWRFHIGDDPHFADPAFDDSTWEAYTIDPTHMPLTVPQAIGASQLPGWQSHGHRGYVGYAWYRITSDRASAGNSPAILMPEHVDDTYEIYVNGKRIGAFGQFEGHRFVYISRPKLFPIPAGILPARGPLTIALRFWASTDEGLPGKSNANGGLRGAPLLGPALLLQIFEKAETGQTIRELWSYVAYPVLYGSVGFISLFLFVFMRTRREYLWAGISLIGMAVMMASTALERFTQLPIQVMFPCRYIGEWIGLSAGPICLMYLLGVYKPLWRRLNYITSAALATGLAINLSLHLSLAPPTSGWEHAMSVLPFALFGNALLALAIAVDGIRTIGAKAWMPLTPGLFGACGLIAEITGVSSFPVSDMLYALVPPALLIVFLLRATEQHRENEQYLLDMRQAQEVQQLLLPEHLPQIAGFSIESVYLPAREVGGDFFQVLEINTGSILIVFGDVAGKGLPAAMLVAMLVGAIRTRAKETGNPAEILSTLNDRLCGNMHGGFATCIAALISSDGTVDLANAGHLEPYVNGKEIGLEGALPLGVVSGIEFATTHFMLDPGDRLTFVSDGVVEAKNSRQELFGFDRLREISTEDAQQIADAAERFGQEDDITVLTFRHVSIPTGTGANSYSSEISGKH